MEEKTSSVVTSNVSTLTDDETRTKFGVSCLVRVLWIRVFFFLNTQEFISTCETCVDFYKWTNEENHEIHQYWYNKTKQLVANLDPNYKTNHWKRTYFKIRQLLLDFGYTINSNKPITIEEKHFKTNERIWHDRYHNSWLHVIIIRIRRTETGQQMLQAY